MKYLLLLTFVYSLSANSFVDQSAFQLIENQTFINNEVIHGQVQKEIQTEELSEATIKLVEQNEILKADLDALYEAELSKKECNEDGDDKKKKRREKNKEKTKENGEWVIGAMFEMNQMDDNENYSMLEAPLSRSQYNQMYDQWLTVTDYDQLKNLIKEQTKGMTDMEVFSYISEMSSRLPYNDDKAKFKQNGDTQSADTLWSMIQEEKKAYAGEAGFGQDDEWGGICGDIHFAALMMGEIARPENFEYFTASYVVGESQHVYMFAVDKKTGQAVVVNYDDTTVVQNPNGVESIAVKSGTNPGGFNNVGTNLRIFANSDGDAKHVATFKSALGSFLYAASTQEHERIGTPIYDDFQTTEVFVTKKNDITKKMMTQVYDKDGNLIKVKEKEKSYTVTNGVKLLHGTRNNGNLDQTDIWTLLYFKQKAKNTDGFGNVIDPKKMGTESNFTTSASKATLGNMFTNEDVYVMQVNYTYGVYKTLLRTDKVDLQANGRFNINGDFYYMRGFDGYVDGNKTFAYNSPSGDGNLETSVGLTAKIKPTENDYINTYVHLDQAIGVKRERELYDWGSLTNNVQLTSNAVRAGINYRRRLSPSQSINVGSNYTGTQVGGMYSVSTGFTNGNHHIFINYQNNAPGINRNISSNLLPNAGQRISFGQGVKINKGSLDAQIGTAFTYLPNTKDFFVGGRVKINLNGKSRNAKKP